MAGIILFIIAAIATVGLGFYTIYSLTGVIKTAVKVNFIKVIKKQSIFTAAFAVAFALMVLSIYLWAKITPTALELVATIFGGLLFPLFGFISLESFMLHYYCAALPKDIDKWVFRVLCIAFPLTFAFVFILSDGFADYVNLTQPLVNGINFTEGWSRPGNYGVTTNLAFYAICILSGALYVYFICDHKFYQKYGKHGILESTLLVAFPAGIIGARLWYVIGNWELEFANQPNPFLAAINTTNGGLTILGGAVMGIVCGIAWVLWAWRKKPYSVFFAMDVIVPAILVAQAVGRWGNFFNCEVHGIAVDEAYFSWLPKVIFNNMHFSGSHSTPLVGQVYVPLFLIEGAVNFLGYFFIAHFCGHKLKGVLEECDLAFMYISWYGMTRVLMEPLRDTAYNMGVDGYWSWMWSLIFVAGGVLLIVGNHFLRHFLRKTMKKEPTEGKFNRGLICTILFAVAGLGMVIPGAVLMGTNAFAQQLIFNEFNVGLILLISGISILLLIAISVLDIIKSFKKADIKEANEAV